MLTRLALALVVATGIGLARDARADRPSFLMPGDIFCLDQLDFDAYLRTGQLHSRGGVRESCVQLPQVTRVIVMRGDTGRAMVWLNSGPMAGSVGWTNARLPR